MGRKEVSDMEKGFWWVRVRKGTYGCAEPGIIVIQQAEIEEKINKKALDELIEQGRDKKGLPVICWTIIKDFQTEKMKAVVDAIYKAHENNTFPYVMIACEDKIARAIADFIRAIPRKAVIFYYKENSKDGYFKYWEVSCY